MNSYDASAGKIGEPRALAEARSQSESEDLRMSQTDRLSLDEVNRACSAPGSEGFVQFFDAFTRSLAVRRKYSAPSITFVSSDDNGQRIEQSIDAADYDNFPIIIVDYYRKPAIPSRTGGQDEYVEIQFNQSQSGHFSADWTRVTYTGFSEGGDDLGKPLDLNGNPYEPTRSPNGQLLFHLVGECWQLVADIRTEASPSQKQR